MHDAPVATPQLNHVAADLIGGAVVPLEEGRIISTSPARPDAIVWHGEPVRTHVDEAVEAARRAFPAWGASDTSQRASALRLFADLCKARADDLADLLCEETGKAMWECRQEVALLPAKVNITLDDQRGQNWGLARVAGYALDITPTKVARCWFRPHGVMAVLGPYNFPLHLPNGHIIPALLAGNTVVFKPSDKAPACGQALAELLLAAMRDAGAPEGVVNLVHGDADNAAALAAHPDVDGVLFTGSWPVGRRILEANLDRPHRIVALEMGGNNAAVVMEDADLRQAAIEVVRCAFNTTGQRCTCTRRLIIHEPVADRFIAAVVRAAADLVVGDPRDDDTFMGPIISDHARQEAFNFQDALAAAGGQILLHSVEPAQLAGNPGHYLTPGIVRVDRFTAEPAQRQGAAAAGFDAGCDEEVFAPLLRDATVKNLDEAIEQANATRYGLAASIFSRDSDAIDRFRFEARAGCVNVNCGTAGASSKLPFGGLGLSGNHRPAGAFSLDYCAYPVAGMTESSDAAVLAPGMRSPDPEPGSG